MPQSQNALDSCTFQLHSWRPFHLQQQQQPPIKTLDADPSNPKPYHTKRPCFSNRATSSFSVETIDMSRLSLIDDDRTIHGGGRRNGSSNSYRYLAARKRRRRGSRSVSGRSSDRSGTRRCCSVGASGNYGTCSDFPVAVGTDSSGELFGNGDANWASDVGEARNPRKERDGGGGGSGEKESNVASGSGVVGFDAQVNESGYGSEPGYRGDAEIGYGDELDEEEEDARVLFWGDRFGDNDSTMEVVGENTFTDQKSHHRCRRKKHDCRMIIDSPR